jgi:hypothetical protein
MADESTLRKIEALIAKAESARELGNMAEAETFAVKAQELLIKYKIDEDLIQGRKQERDKPKIGKAIVNIVALQKSHEGQWIQRLLPVIARNNFCILVFHDNARSGIIYGEDAYLNLVLNISLSLIEQIRRAAKAQMKTVDYIKNRLAWKRAFYEGAVVGISMQLRERMQAAQVSNPTTLPMILDRTKQQLDNHLFEQYGGRLGKKSFSGGSRTNEDAQTRGFQTGKNMSIGSGINLGTGKSNLLN